MRAVYSGDITRDTVAAAYGIRHDRAIKISLEGEAPTLAHRAPLTSTLVFSLVSSENPCTRCTWEIARTRGHARTDAHAYVYYTYVRTHTRHVRTSRGELSGAEAPICATNHDHPTRYRDRWRVYSLPTHCAEIKFYPSR